VLLLAIAGTLLASAAILIIPDANQAFRVAMAEELGSRGISKYSLPRGMNELPLSELSNKSREYEESAFPERAREFRRAYYIRFALPAATFVLSLLALAIGSLLQSRVRRVAAIVIALGLYGDARSWGTKYEFARGLFRLGTQHRVYADFTGSSEAASGPAVQCD
jgi:hypothetical protein